MVSCKVAQKVLNYVIEMPEYVDTPQYFKFDYGHGLKRKHFAIPCSWKNGMFIYFDNALNESAFKKIVLEKSKLVEPPTPYIWILND